MSESTPRRVLGRRRRENVAGGRPHRIPVYVDEAELARLTELAEAAGGITLPRVLIEKALSPDGETPAERKRAMVLLFHLDRQISGMAVNVNQMARRAHVGDGFPMEEARAFLVEARAASERIRVEIDALASAGVGG
jgi:hypothetical protein